MTATVNRPRRWPPQARGARSPPRLPSRMLPARRARCEHSPVRLDDLPEPQADRVCRAKDPVSWHALCINADAARWVAWNVCEDAWYDAETLLAVRVVIEEIDRTTPGLSGPELLLECAGALGGLRALHEDERAQLPPTGINHVSTARFKGKYDVAPESDHVNGSARGELEPTLVPGTRFQVLPRGSTTRWLTFDDGATAVPRVPDDVARTLGLAWDPALGNLVRVEVPLDALCRSGAPPLAIPTLFDVLSPHYPVTPDWRARPEREHRSTEPWGNARDLDHGGAGLPEVIANITAASKMEAEILGPVTRDWKQRPFLAGGTPR